MENIAILGKVAGHVGKSAVSKAAHAATNFISQAKENATATLSPDAATTDPLLDTPYEAQNTEAGWTQATNLDSQAVDIPVDPRDEIISEEEYEKLIKQLDYFYLPERGDNDATRTLWKTPRRFNVCLENFSIENCTTTSYSSVFLLITVGGNLTEVRLHDPLTKTTVPKDVGYRGETFHSPNFALPRHESTFLNFEKMTEWRGSYLHLEKEYLTLELWEAHQFSLNKILAIYQEPLRSVVNTSVMKSATLERCSAIPPVRNKLDNSFRITFQLEFQEIYDYDLTFGQLMLYEIPEESSLDVDNSKDIDTKYNSRDLLKECQTLIAIPDSTDLKKPPPTGTPDLWEGYQGYPTIILSLPKSHNSPWPVKVSAPILQSGQMFSESLTFRGTPSNLETMDITLVIQDSQQPYGAKKQRYEAVLHLRDLNATSVIPFPLYCDQRIVANGKITCAIPFRPKYRQTGQILNIDDKKTYFFVKLIKIDHLYPIPLDHPVDSFLEVTYDGVTKHSAIVYNSLQPHYQSELIFPTDFHKPNLVSDQEFQNQNTILIDVWGSSTIGYQHLGWTEISLSELTNASLAQPQIHHYFDRRKNKDVTYSSRVFSLKKTLDFVSEGDDKCKTSSLLLEIWTKPELNITTPSRPIPFSLVKSPTIPSDLRVQLEPFLQSWDNIFQNMNLGSSRARCLAVDHRKRLLPYNAFIYPLKLMNGKRVDPFFCFNFIRTIAYIEENTYSTVYPCWSSPDFILKSKRGKSIHHALLLSSLFLGVGLEAFVCLGCTPFDDDEFAWVLTSNPVSQNPSTSNSSYRLWDPLTMTVYILPPEFLVNLPQRSSQNIQQKDPLTNHETPWSDAFPAEQENLQPVSESADLGSLTLEKMHCLYGVASHVSPQNPVGDTTYAATLIHVTMSTLPFKSLRVVFNDLNVYGRVIPASHSVHLNLLDEQSWYPLYPSTFPLHIQSKEMTRSLSSTLYDDIVKEIQISRYRLSPIITTLWCRQRSLQLFLEKGLEFLAEIDQTDPESSHYHVLQNQFRQWRLALQSLNPDYHKLRWIYMTFNHMNSTLIVEYLWKSIPFFKETDNSLQFSLGIYIKEMPYDFFLTYIIVLGVTKLSRVQLKQLSLVDKLYKT